MQDREVRTAPNAAFWRPQPRRRVSGRPLTWLLIIGIVVFALASLLGENGLGEYWRLVHQRDHLQQERDELRRASAELEADLQALQHDPEALETLARERYNMRREGEQVIRVMVEPEGE